MRSLTALTILTVLAAPAWAALPLTDDFNDGTVDAAKWSSAFVNASHTGLLPIEEGGFMKFNTGAFLSSVEEFDPATEQLVIRARLRMTDTDGDQENFNIVTRASALPGQFGETHGLGFRINMDNRSGINDSLSVFDFGDADDTLLDDQGNAVTHLNVFGLDIANGDTLDVLITDDGTNFTFEVTDALANVATISGSTSYSGATNGNHISFYNRQTSGALTEVDFINVVVPEPATLGALTLAGLMSLRRRR
ncbi:MAG: hypothetical protein CMJ18_22010 [Phycisphaeraceae bacterium]|nr:hypothetical protein [Phycisphaeraceae bacterium]